MTEASTLHSSHFFSDSLILVKPRISLLALITAAAGMWISPLSISGTTLILALVGILMLVAGANALNMFLERDVDSLMDRTRNRPLPGKRLSPEYGLGLGAVLIGFAIPLLVYGVNPLTGLVGFLSLSAYVLVYTPLKQKTSLSLWVGAIPGAAPPLLGWTAATDSIGYPGLVLFGIIFFWQIPHFLAIGTFRREEYAAAGFKIFPLKQKPAFIRIQMVLYSLFLIPLSLILYPLGYAGKIYLVVAIILNLLFLGSVLWGIRDKKEEIWGRRVFRASLIYLTTLFMVLFFNGGPQ